MISGPWLGGRNQSTDPALGPPNAFSEIETRSVNRSWGKTIIRSLPRTPPPRRGGEGGRVAKFAGGIIEQPRVGFLTRSKTRTSALNGPSGDPSKAQDAPAESNRKPSGPNKKGSGAAGTGGSGAAGTACPNKKQSVRTTRNDRPNLNNSRPAKQALDWFPGRPRGGTCMI